MTNSYTDLVKQTVDFPQEGFEVKDNELYFNDIPLMDIIKQYGTPLRITYLPKIGSQIQKSKRLFHVAMAKVDYRGKYVYCYCTKSSHFSFVMDEVLKNDVHIETSSTFDLQIIKEQYHKKALTKDTYIICNGYKRTPYKQLICDLINDGFNVIPVLDHLEEIEYYRKYAKTETVNLGIRISTEEEPSFRDLSTSYHQAIEEARRRRAAALQGRPASRDVLPRRATASVAGGRGAPTGVIA